LELASIDVLHSCCSCTRKYSRDAAPRQRRVFLAQWMRLIEQSLTTRHTQHRLACLNLVGRKFCTCSQIRGENGVKNVGCKEFGGCEVGGEKSRGPPANSLHHIRLVSKPFEKLVFVAAKSPLVVCHSVEEELGGHCCAGCIAEVYTMKRNSIWNKNLVNLHTRSESCNQPLE